MAGSVPLQTANLLAIPEEVMYGYIFPYLHQNDLLRLRRTCHHIKQFSEGYIRNHCGLNQEKEINETDFTFNDYIQLNFPSSRVYLNNAGPQFFEHPQMSDFLERYAPLITHLRVRHFSTCISDAEDGFFLALTNLQHLELEYTDARERKCLDTRRTVNGVEVPREKCYFPTTFKNLKTLKLGEILGSEIIDQGYAWDFMEYCTEAEYLRHPLYKNMIPGMSTSSNGPFGCVIQLVEKRLQEKPDEPVKLKFYDISFHEEDDGFYGMAYLHLVKLCYDHNIKLLNVHAPLHEMVDSAFSNDYQQFAQPLVSVRDVHGSLFLTELPNLEQMIITSTGKSTFGEFYEGDLAEWPMLEVLDVSINSEETRDSYQFPAEETANLLKFLFSMVTRDGLKDLRIRFDKGARPGRSTLPCPRAADVAGTCKNVTKLTLTNWLGTNKAVSKFWAGLLHLEEVTLEGCQMLGDVAFVGSNRNDPTFLKLNKLKKFTLKGLEIMPKLTNLVFDMVFRHLRIKQFYLHSNAPVKSFTVDGIRSLLTGEFNSSVVKFPFSGWSLDNVPEIEFRQLEVAFRAAHML